MRPLLPIACAALCLAGCAGNAPRAMDDRTYGLLQTVPVEILYVDPHPPLVMTTQRSNSAEVVFSVFGPVGTLVGRGLDDQDNIEARDLAQEELQPYRGQLDRLRLDDALFVNAQAVLGLSPALSHAKLTRLTAYDDARRAPAELALISEAQEVIVLVQHVELSPFGDQLGVGTQVSVYVKPQRGQVVARDHVQLAGYADLRRKPGDSAPCNDRCLGRWFAGNAAELQTELDAALRDMDSDMAAYFRAPVSHHG